MRQTAIALCLISTTILFNACCPQPKQCPTIPQKCVVPYTELPTIDNQICDDKNYTCIVQKTLLNYENMKLYADKLRTNSEVCR